MSKVSAARKPEPIPDNGTATVTVACKIPNGLILELGSRGAPGYWNQTINGSHHKSQVGGFGLTEGVSEANFDAWMEKHKNLEFVRKELLFKQPNASYAMAASIERSELKSGLEPLSQEALPQGLATLSEDQ